MFFVNLGYRWGVASDIEQLQGAVLLPAGNHRERLLRKLPEFRRLLFDPQLYLSSLDPSDCRVTCARLVTYPWFGAENVPEFDSGTSGVREWENDVKDAVAECWTRELPADDAIVSACRTAIEFQVNIGCSHIIIPTPLISEREGEAGLQTEWLDSSIEAASDLEVGQPMLCTVAIAEAAINEAAFESNGFLDAVVDQLSSREGVEGVYIVVVQTHAGHPFETAPLVQRAYAQLSRRFARVGYGTVLTNFADVFGLACIGEGASGFITGESQKLRRISFECFQDDGGGKALPHLYSHPVCAEFLSETGLNPLIEKRLIRRVRDRTEYSDPLFDAIEDGESAELVASWAESQNNVAAAHKHFIRRMVLEARQLMRLPHSGRSEAIEDWLADAEARRLQIQDRFGRGAPGRFAPVGDWLTSLEG